MDEVTPSWRSSRSMETQPAVSRRFFGLYTGVILAVIEPDAKTSLTKKFREYRVALQVWLDGSQGTVEAPHAILGNPLAGLADAATWTLRADAKALAKGNPGTGSKVLVQCINGDLNAAVIVGGVRDEQDADAPVEQEGDLGLHLAYNGLDVTIDADGALEVRRAGPTKADGTLADRSSTDQVGQLISLDKDGGITIATTRADGDDERQEQRITLDHAQKQMTIETSDGLTINVAKGPATVTTAKGIQITAADEDVTIEATKANVTLNAPGGKVRLGGSADQPVVLGDDLASWLQDLLKAIQQMTHGTAVGPSSPPINAAQFAQLGQKVSSLLSKAAQVAASP